jgi:aldehyde:ferredoxin oxidoreductase
LTIGPAGENLAAFATVLAAENASGSSGFGAVMGSKKLKAVVVNASEKKRPAAADPERLKTLAKEVYELRTTNFEDYGHILPLKIRFTACYGCISGCTRGTYQAENGYQFKSLCQASGVYMGLAMKYYGAGSKGARDATELGSRLCDKMGLDTAILAPMIGWLEQCYARGILSEEETCLPLSRIGSIEFIEELTRKISYREGFGDILARGTLKAAEYVGKGSEQLTSAGIITRGSETRDYDPRLFLANALIYATEPRRPIHLLHAQSLPVSRWSNWLNGFKDAFLTTEFMQDIADKLWGGGQARDFNTYEGKALVSRKIQEYGYIKESLILCDLAWPIYQVHYPDKSYPLFTLEGQIVSAITGRELGAPELTVISDRIFNLQRAVLMRQGWGGREGDNLMGYLFEEPFPFVHFDPQSRVPGPGGEPVSRKGAILDRDEFEKLKDEFYMLRGWDVASGLQTRAVLEKLQLRDIASELEKRGLLK